MDELEAQGQYRPHTFNSPGNRVELQAHPVENSYRAYEFNSIEPCSIHPHGYCLPVHMLTCGHIVAIDSPDEHVDYRCGLNCLHVASWIKQQTVNAPAEAIDLYTGKPLGRTLTSTTPLQMTIDPILPELDHCQSHDKIFCEICHGLPASSYFVIPRQSNVKRALALTRTVIQHFTGFNNDQIDASLCQPYHTFEQLDNNCTPTHVLRCGHEVRVPYARPCAANCSDTHECNSRKAIGSGKNADIIYCHECVYRAEKVYERYAQVGKGISGGEGSRMELRGVLMPKKAWDIPHPQVEATHSTPNAGFREYQPERVASGSPLDPLHENMSSAS